MKINDLNIIAQRLGAFGKEHLGIDPRGHTVPTTSSLGGAHRQLDTLTPQRHGRPGQPRRHGRAHQYHQADR